MPVGTSRHSYFLVLHLLLDFSGNLVTKVRGLVWYKVAAVLTLSHVRRRLISYVLPLLSLGSRHSLARLVLLLGFLIELEELQVRVGHGGFLRIFRVLDLDEAPLPARLHMQAHFFEREDVLAEVTLGQGI